MKAMVLVAMCAMVGCANNDALKARVAMVETENARLAAEAKQMKADSDTCVSTMTKLHSLENQLQAQADRAWTAIKEKEASVEPGVKQSVSDGLDTVEQAVVDGANKAVDASKKWAQDHSFISK